MEGLLFILVMVVVISFVILTNRAENKKIDKRMDELPYDMTILKTASIDRQYIYRYVYAKASLAKESGKSDTYISDMIRSRVNNISEWERFREELTRAIKCRYIEEMVEFCYNMAEREKRIIKDIDLGIDINSIDEVQLIAERVSFMCAQEHVDINDSDIIGLIGVDIVNSVLKNNPFYNRYTSKELIEKVNNARGIVIKSFNVYRDEIYVLSKSPDNVVSMNIIVSKLYIGTNGSNLIKTLTLMSVVNSLAKEWSRKIIWY